MTASIVERLADGERLVLDGGTGSELQRRGVEVLHGSADTRRLTAWSAMANLEAASQVATGPDGKRVEAADAPAWRRQIAEYSSRKNRTRLVFTKMHLG